MCVHCISSVLYIYLKRARNEACRCVGYCTISDQRSYIKIQILLDKNPTEIYGALSEVCSEFTVDRSTVFHWANRFRDGCVSEDNDPRPGRPRTSADERSMKLVADAL